MIDCIEGVLVGIGSDEHPELSVPTVEDSGGPIPSDSVEPRRPNVVVQVANDFRISKMERIEGWEKWLDLRISSEYILHRVVNNRDIVSIVFAALADKTRRRMLERLAQNGECRVRDLAQPFSITAPAITKHLHVLERARLVRRRKHGREHYIRPDPEGMIKANQWMAACAAGWQFSLKTLDQLLTASRQGAI